MYDLLIIHYKPVYYLGQTECYTSFLTYTVHKQLTLILRRSIMFLNLSRLCLNVLLFCWSDDPPKLSRYWRRITDLDSSQSLQIYLIVLQKYRSKIQKWKWSQTRYMKYWSCSDDCSANAIKLGVCRKLKFGLGSVFIKINRSQPSQKISFPCCLSFFFCNKLCTVHKGVFIVQQILKENISGRKLHNFMWRKLF